MIKLLLSLSNVQARRMLYQLILAVIISGLAQGIAFLLLVPWLRALFNQSSNAAWFWWSMMALVGIVYVVGTIIASRLGQKSSAVVFACLDERIGDRIAELPLGWFGPERSGRTSDLATRGVMFAASATHAIVRPLLLAFLVPSTVIIGMVFIDWRMAGALLLCTPVMFFAYRLIAAKLKLNDAAHNAAVATASARIIEFARSQPAIRSAGSASVAQELVDAALNNQHKVKSRTEFIGIGGLSIFAVIVQVALIVVIAVGTFFAMGGSLDIATLIALLVLGVRFTEPITNAVALSSGVGMAMNTLTAIQDLIDTPTLPEPEYPLEPTDWSIQLNNVSFGYGSDAVIKGVSFSVPAGSTTAIVGPSGSGKTTITRLIARFYDPDDGQVLIGGVPLPQLGTEQIAANVAPVFQDVYLFDDSILANIWIGRPTASREEVLEAALLARVTDIVDRLPDGWDTRVGEGGANLSGGERQRISIARALLKDAPIVLLDEATSALDAQNEQNIQEAINQVNKSRTTIVVAHRLQTILSADQIIVLSKNGTISESGSHTELLANAGGYARFWNERLSAQGWSLAKRA